MSQGRGGSQQSGATTIMPAKTAVILFTLFFVAASGWMIVYGLFGVGGAAGLTLAASGVVLISVVGWVLTWDT